MHEFTKEQTLLATLKGKFASQFAKRFGDMNPKMVEMIISGAIHGLSDEQFNQGMTRLLAPGNKFMPDIAEFQNWCVSGSWWTATEAWQRACDYSNQSELELLEGKLKITTLTKKAWDSVYWLVEQGSMKEAFKQFKSIYETYLAKAQMQGRQQEWYVPPKMIGTSKAAPKLKSWLPEPTPEEKSWVESKVKEFQEAGMSLPMAMMNAMKLKYEQSAGGGV